MAGRMLLGLFLAIVIGIALLVLGLRGRRVNRHPSCRGCGFDLSGTLPDGVTCPECGAGLKRDRAVRIGQRRRMWSVASIGAALILLPLSGICVTVYSVLTGADIHSYKPAGILLWEAKGDNAQTLAAVAKEFSKRRQAGKLDSATIGRVVDAALAIQGDPDRPWSEDWGDFIEMVNLDGDVTDEQMQRFRNQCVSLACEVRPRIAMGGPLPIKVSHEEIRLSSGSMVFAQAFIRSAFLDGQPFEPRIVPPGVTDEFSMLSYAIPNQSMGAGFPIWADMVSGDSSPWGMGMMMSMQMGEVPMLGLPDEIAPGEHELRLVLSVRGQEVDMNSGFGWETPSEEDGDAQHIVTLTSRFVVTPTDEAGIEVIEPTAELEAEIRDALSPVSGWVYDAGFGGRQAQISLEGGAVPCGIAFDAFLRVGGKQVALGPVLRAPRSGTAAASPFPPGMMSTDLSASIGKADITDATLVLKPNPALALRTTEITRVYGGEIVIESLEIQDVDFESGVQIDMTDTETDEDDGSGSGLGALGRFLLGGTRDTQDPDEDE